MDPTITSTTDPGAIITGLADAVSGKQYNLLAGFILAALIMVADWINVLRFVPAGAKKWAAAGIAFLMALAAGLTAGLPFATIVGGAVTTAVAAIGSYELILRRFDESVK